MNGGQRKFRNRQKSYRGIGKRVQQKKKADMKKVIFGIRKLMLTESSARNAHQKGIEKRGEIWTCLY